MSITFTAIPSFSDGTTLTKLTLGEEVRLLATPDRPEMTAWVKMIFTGSPTGLQSYTLRCSDGVLRTVNRVAIR